MNRVVVVQAHGIKKKVHSFTSQLTAPCGPDCRAQPLKSCRPSSTMPRSICRTSFEDSRCCSQRSGVRYTMARASRNIPRIAVLRSPSRGSAVWLFGSHVSFSGAPSHRVRHSVGALLELCLRCLRSLPIHTCQILLVSAYINSERFSNASRLNCGTGTNGSPDRWTNDFIAELDL